MRVYTAVVYSGRVFGPGQQSREHSFFRGDESRDDLRAAEMQPPIIVDDDDHPVSATAAAMAAAGSGDNAHRKSHAHRHSEAGMCVCMVRAFVLLPSVMLTTVSTQC